MINGDDDKNDNSKDDPLFGEDDFGDFDDFEDDDWDDGSDDDAAAAIEAPLEDGDIEVGPDPLTSFEDFEDDEEDGEYVFETGSSGQKTFLQKYFAAIVALIVFLLGGLWFLGQGGGNQQVPQPQNQGAPPLDSAAAEPVNDLPDSGASPLEAPKSVPDLAKANDLPPQPAPFQTDVLPDALPIIKDKKIETPDGALTPLPNNLKTTKKPVELSDLDGFLKKSADIRKAVPVVDIEEEALAERPTDALPPPSEVTPLVQAELGTNAPKNTTDAAIESNLYNLEVEAAKPAPAIEDVIAAQPVEIIEKISPAAVKEQSAAAAENAALKQEIEDNRAQLDALKQELKATQMRIDTSQKELALVQNIAPKQVVIDKIEAKPAPVVAKTKAPAVAAAQKKRVKKVSKPRKTVIQKKAWVLRSASPGRATLAEKGSNDLISVEVGNNIKGLGRIKSVQIENGRWIVRGTTGSVSR